MNIQFPTEIEAYLKSYFQTDDLTPIVNTVLKDWYSSIVQMNYQTMKPLSTMATELTAVAESGVSKEPLQVI